MAEKLPQMEINFILNKKNTRFDGKTRKILKLWLNKNKNKPYPTLEQKNELAYITGLSLNQINVWFLNAKKRYL